MSDIPAMTERRVKAPGLVWIRRSNGFTPRWVARESDRKAGFRPKTVNLSRWADDPIALAERCDSLWAEMLEWRSARVADPLQFDGTLRSLFLLYQSHPQSTFHQLSSASRRPYDSYLARLVKDVGERTVDSVSGLDLLTWHTNWSNGGANLAASAMCRAVLDAAINFGVMARLKGCVELAAALRATKRSLPKPRPRSVAMTADDVIRLRQAAHAAGRPSSALAYALVFETAIRLWDVIGQWDVVDRHGKSHPRGRRTLWRGLRWEDIDADMVLRYVPSKTSAKTGLAVTFPLSKAPMVMEEMKHWSEEKRSGPIIVCERTRRPYGSADFSGCWRLDSKACGLSSKVWARDLRASGITEGRAAGTATDDVAKVAGHASTKTTATVYDRAVLEAAERFATARVLLRQARRTAMKVGEAKDSR
ncbi:tyrosine-type recombinase/integrase [Mesorhizobium sp. 8]|uniref:tyrosine-type recombinase/integrase n=1 Tax=Mesorhizobium sp. 8 TaxID=2584466 RepID=UPI001120ABE5|nr:tyrosine-type recombinase/integrase [Mesorhizobium sp. 8]QDC00325.1 integrase [Mesorhizobium sp. 8]